MALDLQSSQPHLLTRGTDFKAGCQTLIEGDVLLGENKE